MNAELNAVELAAKAGGFTSDSRVFRENDVFVALRGGKSDGHDHVPSLLSRNPCAIIVRRGWAASAGLKDPRLIEVADTHAAHRALAGAFRTKFRGRVIAIGGSSGKTSTKEFVADLLTSRFRTVRTEKSQNGELGIPKTLEQLRDDVEMAIVEVGIDAPGDMQRHAALVQPDYAVLTSIGEEHLNLLKTVENVFKEETKLFEATLARRGICFAAGGDAWLRRLEGTPGVILVPSDPSLFSMKIGQELRKRLPNAYAVQNATLAVYLARELGMSENEILTALDRLKLPEGRGNVLTFPRNLTLIADHYNSNPSSLKAGLQAAASRSRIEKKPLALILGDMLDLGDMTESLHQSVVADINGANAMQIVLVGPQMARLASVLKASGKVDSYADSLQAAAALKSNPMKDAVVLLKGSRGMALEKILESMS